MWSSLLITMLVSSAFVSASATNVWGDHGILKRQQDGGIVGQVPEGCRTTCGPIDYVLTGCGSPDCVCTVPNYVALRICMDCVVDYGTGTSTYDGLRARGQGVLDTFASDCTKQGLTLNRALLNPSPAPGPPGGGAATGIPNISTRFQNTSTQTPSVTTRPQVGTFGDEGNQGNGAVVLSLSLISVIAMVAGAMVAFM